MQNKKWVQVWGQSHSALSLFYYPSQPKTYRLVMNTAVQGSKLRLTLSNRFGKDAVDIGNITLAKCDANGNVSGGFTDVTFGGKITFTIGKGVRTVSDAVNFDLAPKDYFCVSVYVRSGDLTSGNLLDNALLITAEGNRTYVNAVENETRKRDGVIKVAGKLLGMHFPKPIPLFDTVEVLNGTGASTVAVFGDSVSQQGFWTGPFEERLRETYPGKYSFINRSVMGNRLLRDCSPIFPAKGLYGIRATERVREDIYRFDDFSHVIVFLGVNDVFEYSTINAFPWEKPDPIKVYEAMMDIVQTLKNNGVKVIVFTIPAFGTAPDATREKDALRRVINNLLRANKDSFDGFLDVALEAADPEDDYRSRAELIGPDKLHPNAYGGKYFADMIDMDMFK